MWQSVWFAVESAVLAQAPAPQGQSFFGAMLFPLLIIGVFYFLLIVPNQRRERQKRDMLASLSKGDKVITHGGICGTIVGLTDRHMVLKVSDSPAVKIEFVRQAVSQVVKGDGDNEKDE